MLRKYFGQVMSATAIAVLIAGAHINEGVAASVKQGSPDQTAKVDERTADRLAKDLKQWGTTRVIVEIQSDYEPEAQLPPGLMKNAAKRDSHRQAISRLQERVLAGVSRQRGVKRFRNVPALAMEVSAIELEELKAREEVHSIREDILMEPILDQSITQIGGDAVWPLGYTGTGQTVAILDTGVDVTHPALRDRVVAEACFSSNSSSFSSLCPSGAGEQFGPGAAANCSGNSSCNHGTHVAGIAAGNDANYSGVAPDANLIAIQVFSRSSDGSLLTFFSDVLQALDWLYDQRGNYSIASANLSLGGGNYTDVCDSAYSSFTNMVRTLRGAGIATVVAAGNGGYTDGLSFPACIGDAISVGAVTGADDIARFSNSMPSLNLLAPGTGIKSAMPGGTFANKNGTSMAAPHVAGAFAMLRSAAPVASVDEIMTALTGTGVQLTDGRNGVETPRIQLDAALYALTDEIPVDPPAAPPEIRLVVGELDTGEYGKGYGSDEHESELVVVFDAIGGDLEFAVEGYDIDQADEVSLYLNGSPLGSLSVGPNNGSNNGDRFELASEDLAAGENRVSFVQSEPGATWGVTRLLLSEVPSIQPPVISLTAPVAGAVYREGSDVMLTATASDSDGSVIVVEFYNGNILLGQDSTAPYSYTWFSPAVGSYELSAVAFDNSGAWTESGNAFITVEDAALNEPPVVALTAPVEGASYELGGAIELTAVANDVDGTITRVEFYSGGSKLGEDASAPYGFTWNGAAAGTHIVSAVAIDDAGASASSAGTSILVGGNEDGVSVTLQDGLAGYRGARDAYLFEYHKNSNFGDRAYLVDKSEGRLNRTLLHFAVFKSEGGPIPDGAVITSARLSLYKSSSYDHSYQLHPLLVNWDESSVTWVDRQSGVAWNSPGGRGFGNDIATTPDSYGNASWDPGWVEFDVTGGLQAMSAGRANHGWMLESAGGNSNAKKMHSSEYAEQSLRPRLEIVYVGEDNPANIAPVVALESPLEGSRYVQGDDVQLTASSSDADGTVVRVEFYQGDTLLGQDTTAPFSFTWLSPAVGSYQLSVVAIDDDGAQAQSVATNITVEDNTANMAPVIDLTAPVDGATYTLGDLISLSAIASDADGEVVAVEFYRGSIKLGEDGSAPFTLSWADATAGSYTLTAVAVDDAGATTTSQPISVSVLGTGGTSTVLLQDGLDGYEGSRDAYLFEYHHEGNFGAREYLQEKNSGWRNRTLVQFAIFQSEGGPVPDGATITSARLSLYKSSYYDHEYQLKPLLVGWEEDTVTWDERKAGVSWSVPGGSAQSGDLSASADAQASVGWNPGWIEFDVTLALQDVSAGRDNHGWMLEPLGGNSNTKRLLSSESSSHPLRPKLEVTYSVD